MPGTCITCLSTQNLIVMGEQEWKAFDFILHPFSKEYQAIRINLLARLCTNCQNSMRCIERFRMFAVKNFLQLMSVWNMHKSSPIATFATDDPLNIKLEPQPYYEDITPRKKQNLLIPIMPISSSHSSSVTVLSHTLKSVKSLKKVKEETQSDNEQEETVEKIKTEEESEDHHNNDIEELEVKEERAEVDSEKTITDEELASLRKHGNLPPETCTVCKKTLRNKYSLQKHIKNVHNDEKTRVYCEVCDKWYKNRTYYNQHFKNTWKHYKKEDLDGLKVACKICNKIFNHEKYLKIHMETHNKTEYCKLCDKWYTARSYQGHLVTTLKHISKEDRRFTCDECGEKFATKVLIREHIQVRHQNLKPYKCPHCPEEFNNRTNKNRHVRIMHEKRPYPKNHICEVCGSAWQTSKLLQDHLSVHTGARPYKCGKCDATFGHKSALYLHNRYKHEKKKCPPKKKKIGTTVENTRNKKSTLGTEPS